MEAKISIIIPCYNVAPWLSRCLDSILAQSYGNIEIIAVNDGSTDDTAQVLDAYAARDPRIRTVHKENGGVTSARLRGVEVAAGDWIGFVDGDDEIEPDMYERLLHNAKKHGADISHCGYQMVFPDGRVNFFHNTGTVEAHNRVQALRELLSGQRVEPGLCNKLFRRSLFRGWEMDLSIKINEDLLMNYYLFSQADTSVFEDWCPYRYIVRSTSASRAKMNEHKIYDPIRVKAIIREAAGEGLRNDAKRAYINTCINVYNSLLVADLEDRQHLQNVRNMLKHERKDFALLGRKRAYMARLIAWTPLLYQPIYGIYTRYFQKQIYS